MTQKTWLITGSGNGLGRNIAEAALKVGDNVIAGSRRTEELASLVGRVDLALGVSDYNRRELEALGFEPTGVLPLAVDLSRITRPVQRPALDKILDDDFVNFLFVGRIAPNKKIEDHIRLAEHYKRYVDAYYRFIFVGRHDSQPARPQAGLKACATRWPRARVKRI